MPKRDDPLMPHCAVGARVLPVVADALFVRDEGRPVGISHLHNLLLIGVM